MVERREQELTGTSDHSPFLIGANLPWIEYGEFGRNAWHPAGGLSRRTDLARVADTLKLTAAHGVKAVRWFILCDGRAGIRFDGAGTPVGCDESLFDDVSTALALAADASLLVVPVLFDFLWCARRRIVHGVQLGGRAGVLRNRRQRDALAARVVAPMLERFGDSPTILAWDVMNEPEWVTWRVGTWAPWRSVGVGPMRSWLGQLIDLVHRHTRHPATVGSASARWLWLVRDLGVDVYQPHWYDRLDRRAPLARALSHAGLDRPAWLGEYPTRNSRTSIEELLDRARGAGYVGAFAWSVLARDEASDFSAAGPALARWAAATTMPSTAPESQGV